MNYRTLKQGEQILPGDEFFDDRDNLWRVRAIQTEETLHLATEPNGIHTPHRRKVEYPEHTPPAPPEGMKWEYRGVGWMPDEPSRVYIYDEVSGSYSDEKRTTHTFEAVPDVNPAKFYEKLDQVLTEEELVAPSTGVEEDILLEALRLTTSDRQNQYGPPDQDFARTAAMWSALFGDKMTTPFEARDVALAMICLKLSRETHKRKRDSAVDIAGYARCLHICNEASITPIKTSI